ncbi:MAG: flagellar filament capping protein FliD [Candidatus Competibacteraceae bacterium]|nr:flagellar filament capping protein FliD [Candidatus Competibacteraceae bacterium]MBK7985171.1 flagellar filament capping protein FliD [Candidatus Competibacteraceae bacterium]MBK8895755.1 flagellar filament capping protein FliD [Candidatus Competibacteraceae bacterium]MBK9953221.1 flagellar filament capping protein FliD [Candidatus Competibacteraceae bacterium]
MATITASGMGSGMDINGLVTQLMAAERQPATQRLDRKEAALQTKISAIGNFKSALSTFRSALSGLKDANTFQATAKAAVANDKLFTASASTGAPAGSYSVKVDQLAQAQRLATSADQRFKSLTDEVGTGTLTFQFGSYGGTEASPTFTANPEQSVKTINITAANNTLSGLAKAINDAKIGVQASIVNDGGGYRLVLGSTNTGAANSLKITAADGDGNNADVAGLSLLAYDPTQSVGSGKNMIQTLAGQDARAVIDGLAVTSASNTLKEAIPGVTVDLKSTDSAATTLAVSQDNSAISGGVQSFVKAFNELANTVKALTSYNAETKQAGALQGDFSVRSIFGQLRGELGKMVSGASPQLDSLADLGITTERDGTLKLDSGKLQKAVAVDPQGVAGLFARAGRTTDPLVKYASATNDSKTGDYAVAVSQLATQGSYAGSAVTLTAGSLTLDSSNNTFALKVNGAQSGTISLSQGTFTPAQLAADLQSQINGDSALKAAGASVSVSFSGDKFTLTSASYGASSSIQFTAANAALGFSTGAAGSTPGKDVQGTIGGSEATGSGRKLTGAGGGATGIAVEVLGGSAGERGKVSLSDGLAQRLDNLLNDVLSGDGPLNGRTESLNKQVDRLGDEREKLDTRMTSLESRYRAQFMAMDKLVSQLTATGNYLTQQLSASSSSK